MESITSLYVYNISCIQITRYFMMFEVIINLIIKDFISCYQSMRRKIETKILRFSWRMTFLKKKLYIMFIRKNLLNLGIVMKSYDTIEFLRYKRSGTYSTLTLFFYVFFFDEVLLIILSNCITAKEDSLSNQFFCRIPFYGVCWINN